MKIDLSKETLRVLTANEADLVAGGARATDPSRLPCISDRPTCWRAGQRDAHVAALDRPAD